jgi:hypothetical protein
VQGVLGSPRHISGDKSTIAPAAPPTELKMKIRELFVDRTLDAWAHVPAICQLTTADFAAASASFNIWSSAGRGNSFPARNTSRIFMVL